MQKIQNLLFDLGGVLLNIDYKKTEQAFINLGVTNFNRLYAQDYSNQLFEALEIGKISPAEFYDALRTHTKLPLTDQQIETAWNAMLLNFRKGHTEWLRDIAQRYNIYLYSNTNFIHYIKFSKIYHKQFEGGVLDNLFKKAYYSHEFGQRKPYPQSYTAVLKDADLNPAETLFIDDTLKNIEGAQEAGLQTIHLVSPMKVLDLGL